MENKIKVSIIGIKNQTTGIGAIVIQHLRNILLALEKGYIPIVDKKHCINQYFKDGKVFKDNTWEYFFEQPCGYTLDDINDDVECIIDNYPKKELQKYMIEDELLPTNPKEKISNKLSYLNKEFKKYIRFNETTKNYVIDKYNEIIQGDENVLGILVRGTDYTQRRTYSEPMQPDIKKFIKKIYEYLAKYPNITKIYIATEDEDVYQVFKKEFGDKLLDNGQYRYSYSGKKDKLLSENIVARKDHNCTLAMEYLSSIYILSKCKYFVGGLTSGTKLAYLFQDCWEDFYIYHLGRYGKTFKERLFSITHSKRNGLDCKIIKFLGIKIKI